MTIHPLPTTPTLPTEPTTPVPWTDASLTELVAAVRAGDEHATLCDRFRRGTQSITTRLRLLLPVEERKCPTDRVLPRLRELLRDESYDWRAALLQTAPPPPVIRHEHKGLDGLTEHQLIQVAAAVFNAPFTDATFAAEVRTTVRDRGLVRRVENTLTQRLVASGVPYPDAVHAVEHLWDEAQGGGWWHHAY